MSDYFKSAKSKLNTPRTDLSEKIAQPPTLKRNIQFRKSDLPERGSISGLVQGSIAVRELSSQKNKRGEEREEGRSGERTPQGECGNKKPKKLPENDVFTVRAVKQLVSAITKHGQLILCSYP